MTGVTLRSFGGSRCSLSCPPSPFPADDGQRDGLGGERRAGTPLAPKLQLITVISISKPPPGSLVHTTRQFRATHFYLKTFIKRICYSKQATQSVLGLSKSCLLRCLRNDLIRLQLGALSQLSFDSLWAKLDIFRLGMLPGQITETRIHENGSFSSRCMTYKPYITSELTKNTKFTQLLAVCQ